jgi:hypothetical protein
MNTMSTATASRPSTASGESTAPHRAATQRPPARAARERFEDALRRHQLDDEVQPQPDAAVAPWGQAQAYTAAPQPSAKQPELAVPTGVLPRTAAAQDAVSAHLRALGASPTEATAAHVQLQWAGSSAPVQQVDLRRGDGGALHLDMSGNVHASDPARLARLRDRVAARVASSEVYVLASQRPTHERSERNFADEQPR